MEWMRIWIWMRIGHGMGKAQMGVNDDDEFLLAQEVWELLKQRAQRLAGFHWQLALPVLALVHSVFSTPEHDFQAHQSAVCQYWQSFNFRLCIKRAACRV